MFRVLINQHYQHRTNQNLRLRAKAVFQNRGVWGQAFLSLPSPMIPFFFLLSSQRSRQTRAEMLATQARPILVASSSQGRRLFPCPTKVKTFALLRWSCRNSNKLQQGTVLCAKGTNMFIVSFFVGNANLNKLHRIYTLTLWEEIDGPLHVGYRIYCSLFSL